eukprot:tig00001484_g8913.t1
MRAVLALLLLAAAASAVQPDLGSEHDSSTLQPIPQAAGSLRWKQIADEVNGKQRAWTAGPLAERFAGMSLEEIRAQLNARADDPPSAYMSKGEIPIKEAYALQADDDLPTSFDARKVWPGSIHDIRDQGRCGSCWAFATTEVLSDRFSIATNNSVDVVLSPEHLLACDWLNFGCHGGFYPTAWLWIKDHGLVSEECFPYVSGEDGAMVKCPRACSNGGDFTRYKALHWYRIGSWFHPISQEIMMREIMNHGPIAAMYEVYEDFLTYKSGVYAHTTGVFAGRHAIKIIGWGEEGGVKYWLVANSWGKAWGEAGFFRIRRGTNECQIEGHVYGGTPNLQALPAASA